MIHFVPYPDGYIFDDALTVQLTPTEQQFGITFNVFGKSHAAIKAAKSAVMELCEDESNVVVLNTEQDKVSIAKLTANEVNIYLISLKGGVCMSFVVLLLYKSAVSFCVCLCVCVGACVHAFVRFPTRPSDRDQI